jgi:hypothetical protein
MAELGGELGSRGETANGSPPPPVKSYHIKLINQYGSWTFEPVCLSVRLI